MTLTLDECREIRRLYEAGSTIKGLVRQLGMHHTRVSESIRRAGGTVRPPVSDARIGLDLRRLRKLVRDLERDATSMKAIAIELGVCYPTAAKLVRWAGGRTPREASA